MEKAVPRFLGDEGLGPDYERQLDEALDRLETLPVVKDAHIDIKKRRVIANLWCQSTHPSGTMRQLPVSLNRKADDDPTAVPTYLVAVQKLIKKIENEHRGCLEAAEASKASFNSKAGAASSSTPMAPTTFEAMMRLDSARARAVEANAVALAAEKARDAAEAEVEMLKASLGSKRPRTESASADGAEAEPTHPTEDWDLADHRREMTRVMNRRAQLPLGHVLARSRSCWCPACSRVCGPSSLTLGWGGLYHVPGCMRTNLTVWRAKPRLTSTAAAGIANGREFVKELWSTKLRGKVQPGKFGAVQADALWSESERKHFQPGHHWIFEFGDAGGDKGSFLESFKLAPRCWKLYEGTRFYDGEAALKVKRWFHRTDDDPSGC